MKIRQVVRYLMGYDPQREAAENKSILRLRNNKDVDLRAALAVSDQEAWWLAVHQVINELELETVQGARNQMANPNLCIGAVGAGEGVAMVRQRLIEVREAALHAMKDKG